MGLARSLRYMCSYTHMQALTLYAVVIPQAKQKHIEVVKRKGIYALFMKGWDGQAVLRNIDD